MSHDVDSRYFNPDDYQVAARMGGALIQKKICIRCKMNGRSEVSCPKHIPITEQESIKAMLQEKFDINFGLDLKGTAFIHVAVIGTDGVRYGGYKRINERCLRGRQIKYELVDYAPGILVLDSEFNPKGCVWSRPLI